MTVSPTAWLGSRLAIDESSVILLTLSLSIAVGTTAEGGGGCSRMAVSSAAMPDHTEGLGEVRCPPAGASRFYRAVFVINTIISGYTAAGGGTGGSRARWLSIRNMHTDAQAFCISLMHLCITVMRLSAHILVIAYSCSRDCPQGLQL